MLAIPISQGLQEEVVHEPTHFCYRAMHHQQQATANSQRTLTAQSYGTAGMWRAQSLSG